MSKSVASVAAEALCQTGLAVTGKRVALTTALFRPSPPGRTRTSTSPRLRFDRTALTVVARVQKSLEEAVPRGRTVIFTLTAPIRLPARTAAAIEERIRSVLARHRVQWRGTLHGNGVRVSILRGGGRDTSKLIGFVHNPAPDAAILIDMARVLLARAGTDQRRSSAASRERWLIVLDPRGIAPLGAFRAVCAALRLRRVFARVLLVLPGGRVATVTD